MVIDILTPLLTDNSFIFQRVWDCTVPIFFQSWILISKSKCKKSVNSYAQILIFRSLSVRYAWLIIAFPFAMIEQVLITLIWSPVTQGSLQSVIAHCVTSYYNNYTNMRHTQEVNMKWFSEPILWCYILVIH